MKEKVEKYLREHKEDLHQEVEERRKVDEFMEQEDMAEVFDRYTQSLE